MEFCIFLGPLGECNFPEEAGLGDHIRKFVRNPLNVGRDPSEAVLNKDNIKSRRLKCASTLYSNLNDQVMVQIRCDGHKI